jgi:pimeloyl-ACP methyl ester carboxylesterase
MLRERTVPVHGKPVTFQQVGPGPSGGPVETVVLLHGLAGSTASWAPVLTALAEQRPQRQFIAIDLLGHGHSTDPAGDHSMGGYATAIRDFLATLGIHRATLIGHSLGGGVAMQFAYQFPEWCDRLVLVASGGLGRSVHLALRAAALPGAELVLPLLACRPLFACGQALGRLGGKLGLRLSGDAQEYLRHFSSLCQPAGRAVFTRTVRSALDAGGQRLTGTDRLAALDGLPVLLVWGTGDRVIPVWHGIRTWRAVPDAEIELFDGVGHFPHHADPARFVDVLLDFLRRRPPGRLSADLVASAS